MNNTEYQKAALYSKLGINGTGYLAYRDIPQIIKKHVHGSMVLDFGCGSGRSTRFLKSLGLLVNGVDISQEMIKKAKEIDDSIPYFVINHNRIPSDSNVYDLVFSCLVLFEISSKDEILTIFNETSRVLNDKGIFIIITGSVEMYNHKWLSLKVDYEENKNLSSGSKAKILLKEVNLELYDYYWTDEDYKNIINSSKFSLIEQLSPLGTVEDYYNWVSEYYIPPYVIYVLQKNLLK